MDNLSFNHGDDSLIKTITLPGQALFGFQNDDLACKVRLVILMVFYSDTVICISIYCKPGAT